jgi:hypothetical protein
MKLLITAFLVAFANAQESDEYVTCMETNCPDRGSHAWPEGWGQDAGKDIEYILDNPAAATIVVCICTSCSEYEDLHNWPAYQEGGCEEAEFSVCVATNCPGALQFEYPDSADGKPWGEDAASDLTTISEHPGVAYHVDCMCSNCRGFSRMDAWPANAGNAGCTTAANHKLPTSATPSAWTKDDPDLCDDTVSLKLWLEKGVQCSCKYSEVCSRDNPGGAIYNEYTLQQALLDRGVSCPNPGECQHMTPAPTPLPAPPVEEASLTCHPALLGLVAVVAFM